MQLRGYRAIAGDFAEIIWLNVQYSGLGRKFEERLMCRKEPRNVSPALQMARPSPATPDKATNYKKF